MKERREKLFGQRARDEATLDFACKQAQEAILNPDLPEFYKDYVLNLAIKTVQKVAEKRAAYYAKHGEGRRTRKQP
jgi:hypothetical protein